MMVITLWRKIRKKGGNMLDSYFQQGGQRQTHRRRPLSRGFKDTCEDTWISKGERSRQREQEMLNSGGDRIFAKLQEAQCVWSRRNIDQETMNLQKQQKPDHRRPQALPWVCGSYFECDRKSLEHVGRNDMITGSCFSCTLHLPWSG